MRNMRPLGWVIIALNVYFIYSFFSSISSTDSDTVIGFGFFFLMIWLAVMNVVLYVIYRITGRRSARTCPACAKRVKVGLVSCANCGFNFLTAASGNSEQQAEVSTEIAVGSPVQKSSPIDKRSTGIALAVIVLLCSFAYFGQTSNDSSTGNSSSQTAADNSWIPAGFMRWDDKVAYNYIEDPKCTYSNSICVGVQIVSKDGCLNSLYGEISIEDKKGVQIGYTNDTLSSLPAGSKGELIFDILEWERFGGFNLTKISCY